jgi:hypothetical protein
VGCDAVWRSEERISSIIRVKTTSELGAALAVTRTLWRNINYEKGSHRMQYTIAFFDIQLVFLPSLISFLVTANAVQLAGSLHRMVEAIHASETSFLKTATQRHIPEDGTLHSHDLLPRRQERTRMFADVCHLVQSVNLPNAVQKFEH